MRQKVAPYDFANLSEISRNFNTKFYTYMNHFNIYLSAKIWLTSIITKLRVYQYDSLAILDHSKITQYKTNIMSNWWILVTADDIMSDVNFQNDNLFNICLKLSETTEFGQVEESRQHVSSSLNRQQGASAGSWWVSKATEGLCW